MGINESSYQAMHVWSYWFEILCFLNLSNFVTIIYQGYFSIKKYQNKTFREWQHPVPEDIRETQIQAYYTEEVAEPLKYSRDISANKS